MWNFIILSPIYSGFTNLFPPIVRKLHMPRWVISCEKQTLALLNMYGKFGTELHPQPPPYLYPILSTLTDGWDGSSQDPKSPLLISKAENSLEQKWEAFTSVGLYCLYLDYIIILKCLWDTFVCKISLFLHFLSLINYKSKSTVLLLEKK